MRRRNCRAKLQTPLAAAHQDGGRGEGECGKAFGFRQMNCYGKKVFLTAEWKHLAMLNYEIDPIVLVPLVPAGTELDLWNGKTLVSVVGFLFVKTRVFGIPIPFHRDFEEVNLRIYVRRKAEGRWRRGVVLIKEIVPRAAIALAARKLYNEPYLALPMAHRMICCSLVCCSLGSDLNTKHSAKLLAPPSGVSSNV